MRLVTVVCLTTAAVLRGGEVQKVEPPGWWPGHSLNPVRVLVTGRGLAGAISTEAPGLRVDRGAIMPGGRHAFFDLRISPSVRPGRYDFAIGANRLHFEILQPLPRSGRFQGFSPDDVIYLIMPDRFANGDAGNDGSLHDRANQWMYHGGDFQGILDRLPYLKDLGVTTLWLTPVYDNANQADQTRRGPSSSYHGYGAVDFYRVEEHFGDLAKFRELCDRAHSAGLKIMLDQVANHTGERHPWSEYPPTPGWLNGSREKHAFGSGALWSLVDPYGSGILQDRVRRGWFVGRLPDINHDDPEAARYLIQNALWWTGISGIDAIRQDTVPYVPKSFWRKWHAALQREHPSLRTLGEVYNHDPVLIASFQDAGFTSLFDFPLYHTLRRALARGRRLDELPQSLIHDRLFKNPSMMVNFLGLHDVPRLRHETAAIDAIKQAFTFLLTTRGIPVVYYGDEIALPGAGDPDNRRDFPGGWKEDKRNAFEPSGRTPEEAEVFGHVRSLLHLRRKSDSLRRGKLSNLHAGADTYVYARRSAAETFIVALGKPAEFTVDGYPDARAADALGSGSSLRIGSGKATVSGPGVFRVAPAHR